MLLVLLNPFGIGGSPLMGFWRRSSFWFHVSHETWLLSLASTTANYPVHSADDSWILWPESKSIQQVNRKLANLVSEFTERSENYQSCSGKPSFC